MDEINARQKTEGERDVAKGALSEEKAKSR